MNPKYFFIGNGVKVKITIYEIKSNESKYIELDYYLSTTKGRISFTDLSYDQKSKVLKMLEKFNSSIATLAAINVSSIKEVCKKIGFRFSKRSGVGESSNDDFPTPSSNQ